MAWTHNTWFGNSETENKVVSPQGHIVVSTAGSASFLGINWATRNTEQKMRAKLSSGL